MKIAIIEPECHSEQLKPLLQMLLKAEQHQWYVFVRLELWHEAGLEIKNTPAHIQVILSENNEKKLEWMNNMRKAWNQMDVLFFLTLQEDFWWMNRQTWSSRIIMRVHNAHFLFDPKPKKYLPRNWSDWRLRIKQFLKGEQRHRKAFLQKVAAFVPINKPMHDLIVNLGVTNERLSSPIPLVFPQIQKPLVKQEGFNLVMPGAFDPVRRNYDLLLQIVEIWAQNGEGCVNLILLGAYNGKEAKTLIQKLKERGGAKLKIISYEHFVTAQEYEKQMSGAQAILSCIQVETRFHNYHEVYGQSKLSAAVHEALNYGLPIVMPEAYGNESDLDSWMLSFASAEQAVTDLINLNTNQMKLSLTEESYYLAENQLKNLLKIVEG